MGGQLSSRGRDPELHCVVAMGQLAPLTYNTLHFGHPQMKRVILDHFFCDAVVFLQYASSVVLMVFACPDFPPLPEYMVWSCVPALLLLSCDQISRTILLRRWQVMHHNKCVTQQPQLRIFATDEELVDRVSQMRKRHQSLPDFFAATDKGLPIKPINLSPGLQSSCNHNGRGVTPNKTTSKPPASPRCSFQSPETNNRVVFNL